MGTLLRKMTDGVRRMTGTGAMLNAMHERDRVAASVDDVDTQLRRMGTTSSPRAA